MHKPKEPALQAKEKPPFFGGQGFFSAAPAPMIQRDIGQSIPVASGVFDIDMRSQEGAKASPPTSRAGEDGSIAFDPAVSSPYSNEIRLIQVIRDRDTAGNDVNISSMPPGRGESLRTTAGLGSDVEAGFSTDVLHQDFDNAGNPTTVTPQGAQKGLAYEGGTPIYGFKRSNDPRDIKSARIEDTPYSTGDWDFDFETVAKGEDTGVIYGSLHWSFGTRHGRVVNEKVDAEDAQSATFDAAVEKHRDFYVHEPVVFYFDYKKDELSTTEAAKIDEFLDYLHRFPDVRLSLDAYADNKGDALFNLHLSEKRGDNVIKALIAKKVDPARISKAVSSWGSTEEFTSGDLAPNPGRSQNLEANRRGNRRVVLTFSHTQSLPAP
ncbi:MAG TPA: OmpA family protein [Puia sp.]|jgi:outer membrane protein OmpA-like peptidoglycan-associated protein|nr:OmpA family protein [Puia sp.]